MNEAKSGGIEWCMEIVEVGETKLRRQPETRAGPCRRTARSISLRLVISNQIVSTGCFDAYEMIFSAKYGVWLLIGSLIESGFDTARCELGAFRLIAERE